MVLFPRTPSPNPSLLFFGTISKLALEDYQRRFLSMSDAAYLDDLLKQSHTVAGLLKKKFQALQMALWLLALAILPWAVTIYLSKSS